jgi:ribosomal protein L30/L7E
MSFGIKSAVQEAHQVAQQNAGKWFRVTLKKSLIGLDWRLKRCAEALGLRRVGQHVYKPVDANQLGNIVKLKELVRVEIKKGLPVRDNRSHPCGFEVIGNLLYDNSNSK